MKKVKWYLKQLLPLQYISEYAITSNVQPDQRILVIWRMWFGHCFWTQEWLIQDTDGTRELATAESLKKSVEIR